MIPKIQKILYATDRTKNSCHAFLYAIDLAKSHGAKIVVLHVREPIPSYAGISFAPPQEELDKTAKGVRRRINTVCKETEAQVGFPCATMVSKVLVPYGYPPEEILKATEKESCDAIVLGTHGKGFLGSVSIAVLHQSQKPVFVVPLPPSKKAASRPIDQGEEPAPLSSEKFN